MKLYGNKVKDEGTFYLSTNEVLGWDRINGEPRIAPFTIGGLGSFLFFGCVV